MEIHYVLPDYEKSIQHLDEFGIEYHKQEKKHQFFRAEILEVNEKSIFVKPDADSIETNVADKIYVSLDVTSSIPVPTLKVGDRVHIIHRGNILETYPAQIQDPYVIYLLSDSGEILSPTPKKTDSPMIIDKTSFDIDGDGVKEDCILTYGPTSGLFTFEFYVSENGIDEYFNIYNTEFYHLTFIEDDGILKVKGITQGENPETYIFDISIKDKNIILSNNGKNLANWGEQGVNSKYR